jgi:hypothetical protein
MVLSQSNRTDGEVRDRRKRERDGHSEGGRDRERQNMGESSQTDIRKDREINSE